MNEEQAERFLWTHARLLERAMMEYHFLGGSGQQVIDALRCYQREDGGFGHALEPDIRAPESQPVFVEFALRTLYECGLRDEEMATRACRYVAERADLKAGIPSLYPSARAYPRAGHWENPFSERPSPSRLTGLIGLLAWQKVEHPWLKEAVKYGLEDIASCRYEDAHTILTAFCLLESAAAEYDVEPLRRKLAGELEQARYFIAETPVREYGLTPLDFAPHPDAYCRSLFREEQLAAHLLEMEATQQVDGGWAIGWEPPGETARWEWRSIKTLNCLRSLRAYRQWSSAMGTASLWS
ncbi:hypothetical protein [Gorillibacterium sp. sgz5001074]|uniref:hypothetical protein n=1 Tax=Gorillibacterium sp. sgz5001074 TaxID=3446695 RepID=UPI003F664450